MARYRPQQQQQHYLYLFGGLTLVLGTLAGIGAAAGGVAGGVGGGAGGGGRGSGYYNYGSYGGGPGSSQAGGGGGGGGLGMRRGAGVYGPPMGLGNPHDPPRSAAGGVAGAGGREASRGKSYGRLSAWGIITIVTFVILIGAGAYWSFICYPFFCKKERHYNVMLNMSSATTATPSTRSTEFEKLDNCCAKSTTSTRSNDTGISNI